MCKVLNARQDGKHSAGSRVYVGRPSKWGKSVRHRARRYARGGDREVPRVDRTAAGADGGAARAARQGRGVLVRAGALSCGGADRAGERRAVSGAGWSRLQHHCFPPTTPPIPTSSRALFDPLGVQGSHLQHSPKATNVRAPTAWRREANLCGSSCSRGGMRFQGSGRQLKEYQDKHSPALTPKSERPLASLWRHRRCPPRRPLRGRKGAFGRAPTFGRVGLYHAAKDGRVTKPPSASWPFWLRSLTRNKRHGRHLMSGHGARCERAGGALNKPRGLNRLGGPTAATATSSSPVACGGPSPPTDAPGCGSRSPEATRLRRVLHCVPAQASKLAWVPRTNGCREGAHDGGEMGLRRIAKE